VPAQSVLVVEDTDEIRELVTTVLRRAGFDVREAASGAACLEEIRRDAPDLIVLDLGLPDADGTEICRQIRAETQCYVLMLTARAEEVDLLIGLAVGADGYMAKPFSPRELVARVRALLRRVERAAQLADERRAAEEESARLDLGGGLVVDVAARRVEVGGAEVHLTRTEFDLLHALARRPGHAVGRDRLLADVWDWPEAPSGAAATRAVDSHVKALRRKIGAERIRTVHGVGYALEPA